MTAGVLTQVGTWVRNFAILLFVVEKTGGDALAVSFISVAECAQIFLFSFLGGTFADRWQPKRTMVWCALLSGMAIFVISVRSCSAPGRLLSAPHLSLRVWRSSPSLRG